MFEFVHYKSNNFSPFIIETWTIFTTAWKAERCFSNGCLNRSCSIENSFNLPFNVSCRASIRFSNGVSGCLNFGWRYPLSASVISSSAKNTYKSWAILRSGHSPHGKPPDAQTMSPPHYWNTHFISNTRSLKLVAKPFLAKWLWLSYATISSIKRNTNFWIIWILQSIFPLNLFKLIWI